MQGLIENWLTQVVLWSLHIILVPDMLSIRLPFECDSLQYLPVFNTLTQSCSQWVASLSFEKHQTNTRLYKSNYYLLDMIYLWFMILHWISLFIFNQELRNGILIIGSLVLWVFKYHSDSMWDFTQVPLSVYFQICARVKTRC